MELTRTLHEQQGRQGRGLCAVGRAVVDLYEADPETARQLDEWSRVPPRTVDADGPTPSADSVRDWLAGLGYAMSSATVANHRAALTTRARGHCACTPARIAGARRAREARQTSA